VLLLLTKTIKAIQLYY